jgi:elongation factor G
MTRRTAIERIRNLGIIAHVDAGKTTLTERVLYFTGRIHEPGDVHRGNTRTDSHPSEIDHGITILAAAVTCDWRDHRFHLIDTPGHVDFTIEVERSLRVLDGAVCVLDGVAGVEPQTETVWRQADRHRVPRIVFVNKLDRVGADYPRCLAELADRLGARPIAVNWPVHDGDTLVGVVDLIEMTALLWDDARGDHFHVAPVPASLSDNCKTVRERLIEACADADPAVLAAIVDGREPAPAALRTALRAATIAGRAVPVFAGSAYKNRGVQPLLDGVVDYLPSPVDRPAVTAVDGTASRPADAQAPLAALGFKVAFDEHGQSTFVRVYSGVLEKGMTVVAARARRTLRVGRLVQLHAAQRVEVERLAAGDIGAILGAPLANGETLSDPDHPIVLEAIAVPEPVVRVAIEAKTSADRDRLGVALNRMVAADPSLRVETDVETGQTLLAGMGQLHLAIAVERLANDHHVAVTTGRPLVAYRTTLARAVRHDHRHVKQSGGPGQFAQITIEVGPAPRGAGLVFVDQVKGGAIPREWIGAIADGVTQAMADGLPCDGGSGASGRMVGSSGVLAGAVEWFPVVDVHVTVVDGATHPKDSSELAFRIAGAQAFKAAAQKAGAVKLEPVMRLEVTCRDEDVGAVIGDVARRRGQVLGLDSRGPERVVRAEVPLAESFGYAGALSALTHGHGRFVLEPDRYEPVPA